MAGKKRTKITQKLKDEARSLWEEGRTTRDIADSVGVSYGAIRVWITKWRKGIVADASLDVQESGEESVVAEVIPISMALQVAVPIRRDPRVAFATVDRAVVTADESVIEMSGRAVKSMVRSTVIMMDQVERDLEEQALGERVTGVDRDLGQSVRLMVGCMKELLSAVGNMGADDKENDATKRMLKEASRVAKLTDGEELDAEFAAMKERMRLSGGE